MIKKYDKSLAIVSRIYKKGGRFGSANNRIPTSWNPQFSSEPSCVKLNNMSATIKSAEEHQYGGYRGGNILAIYAAQFRPEPSPFEFFRQHVSQWFFASKLLRFFESNKLGEKPDPSDLASHRVICSALITFGEFAGSFARNNKTEANLDSVGLSVDCIEAETRLLRDNFRMLHDNTMSFEEAEAILTEAFG